MTLQKVRKVFAENRRFRWQAYLTLLLVVNGIYLVAAWPAPPRWWNVLPAPMLLVPYLGCMAMAVRTADMAKRRRLAEAEASAKLRTLKAPDAVPGQCPVCSMDDLDALAADDKLMERGEDRRKVVPYGMRRAHRDCAEFVPYKAPRENSSGSGYVLTGQHIGAHWTCFYCHGRGRASSEGAAEMALREHALTCAARPGKLRASIDADTIAALFAEANDRPQHTSTTGNSWLWPRTDGWRR